MFPLHCIGFSSGADVVLWIWSDEKKAEDCGISEFRGGGMDCPNSSATVAQLADDARSLLPIPQSVSMGWWDVDAAREGVVDEWADEAKEEWADEAKDVVPVIPTPGRLHS